VGENFAEWVGAVGWIFGCCCNNVEPRLVSVEVKSFSEKRKGHRNFSAINLISDNFRNQNQENR